MTRPCVVGIASRGSALRTVLVAPEAPRPATRAVPGVQRPLKLSLCSRLLGKKPVAVCIMHRGADRTCVSRKGAAPDSCLECSASRENRTSCGRATSPSLTVQESRAWLPLTWEPLSVWFGLV